MNDTATPMHIIEAQQNLLRDLLADTHGDAFVLMPLDQTEEVFSKHFEHHANVCAVGSLMPEMVKEGDYMRSAGMRMCGGGRRVRIRWRRRNWRRG